MKRGRSYRRHQFERARKRVARRLRIQSETAVPDREIGKFTRRRGHCFNRSCRIESQRLKKMAIRSLRHNGRVLERMERHG
ncbi:MAG: hypothetical protein HKN23_11915 [Verrucomicrobiales bacterium]|nr:hypothetical protein [Verrucomicrobiales bacterium]